MATSWQTPLTRTIWLADGGDLATLDEAREYVLALSFPNQSTLVWQHVARLLMEAAETGETDSLCAQLEHALRMDGRLRKDLQSGAIGSR
jgi:hypothetical protein